MKIAIVDSSKLGVGCWSALRFTGSCNKCNHVTSCIEAEAKTGRISLAKSRVQQLEEKLQEANQAFAKTQGK